jgi:hypothetical protein
VYTTRNEDATTFQALELANGSTLAKMIHRGVMRLMGELPPAPASLFDSFAMRKDEKEVEFSVKGLKQVFLLTEDAGTYDQDKAEVGWAGITLSGPAGTKVLEAGRLRTKIGSRRVYEVDPGFETLRAKVWISDASKASDINTSVRFFAFGSEPDMTRLVKVAGESPWPEAPKLTSVNQTIDYFWRGLLSRRPTNEERLTALELFPNGKLQREGTEDLLWSLLMHPEFQFTW